MAYVYRFKHYLTSEIIYVGYTSRTLNARMNEHFGTNPHLPTKCYKSVGRIEYIKVRTNSDARLIEQYLINKYKPIYNIAGKSSDEQTIKLRSIPKRWTLYEDRKRSFIRLNLFGFNPFKNNKKVKHNRKSKNKSPDMVDFIFKFIIVYVLIAAILENI